MRDRSVHWWESISAGPTYSARLIECYVATQARPSRLPSIAGTGLLPLRRSLLKVNDELAIIRPEPAI
jgi:hypothetical protein